MIAMTEGALDGRGSAALGEWREQGNAVYHLRRRLTVAECMLAGGLIVRDLRGSDEAARRLEKLFAKAPWLRAHAVAIGEAA